MAPRPFAARPESFNLQLDEGLQMFGELLHVDTGPAIDVRGPLSGKNRYSHDRQGTALLACAAWRMNPQSSDSCSRAAKASD